MTGFFRKSGTYRQERSFPQDMSTEVSFYRKKYGIMATRMMEGISIEGTYENADYFKSVVYFIWSPEFKTVKGCK